MTAPLVPIFFYSSKSGQIAKFCERVCAGTGRPAYHLGVKENRGIVPDGPWVLVTGQYQAGNEGFVVLPAPVERFLADPVVRKRMVGVMSSGNRNFGAHYQVAGRRVVAASGRPMLLEFELQGTRWDVADARAILAGLDVELAATTAPA